MNKVTGRSSSWMSGRAHHSDVDVPEPHRPGRRSRRTKLLSKEDIEGSIGDHLTLMAQKTAIQEYMDSIDWNQRENATQFGKDHPFTYLKFLIDALEKDRISTGS